MKGQCCSGSMSITGSSTPARSQLASWSSTLRTSAGPLGRPMAPSAVRANHAPVGAWTRVPRQSKRTARKRGTIRLMRTTVSSDHGHRTGPHTAVSGHGPPSARCMTERDQSVCDESGVGENPAPIGDHFGGARVHWDRSPPGCSDPELDEQASGKSYAALAQGAPLRTPDKPPLWSDLGDEAEIVEVTS